MDLTGLAGVDAGVGDDEDMAEDLAEYVDEDDIPLSLQARQPVGAVPLRRDAPTTRDSGVQTGGVRGAGKAVKTEGEEKTVSDAGTLVRRMKVTLPLIKALNVDKGLTSLLLNHLIATATK